MPPAPTLPARVGRRRLLGGGLALSLGGLVACGRQDGPAAGGPTGGFPRMVRHEAGETHLEAPPRRVACVTDGAELCAALALGVRPVGFGQRTDPLPPWLIAAGASAPEIEKVPLDAEPNMERLAAWAPDLIIGQFGYVTPETIGQFTKLAPTVATSFIDWRQSLRQVAGATGTEAAADRVEADLDTRVAAGGDRLRRFGSTRVTILTVFPGDQLYRLNRASPAGRILAQLGFPSLPEERAVGEAADPVAAELAGTELDGDVALVLLFDNDRAPYDAARAKGIFDRVSAFRTGRVVELPDIDAQALYFSSVLTVTPALEVLERALGAALI